MLCDIAVVDVVYGRQTPLAGVRPHARQNNYLSEKGTVEVTTTRQTIPQADQPSEGPRARPNTG